MNLIVDSGCLGLAAGGWVQEIYGPRVMYGAMASIVFVGMLVLILAEINNGVNDVSADKDEIKSGECDHLVKSESVCSSGSAFADQSTEKWVRTLKYDSLSKYKHYK